MGINGLLPLMKAASTNVSLSKLNDTIAAVDTNVWIHRACYSCADKIFLNEPTEMFVQYCINNCKILIKNRITPILVFDGQNLPAKYETKLKRKKRKQEIREKIGQLLKSGNDAQARWLMRQCVDVTFKMVHKVIERLRKEKIDYIVAPFEADAQITFLVNNGFADFAITEDSDLLVFGCRKALYKFDRDTERGQMIDLDRLPKCFKKFDFEIFQYMCTLSGCDYLTNLTGIGIGRSKKFFESLSIDEKSVGLTNIGDTIKLLPAKLNMVGKVNVTDDYISKYIQAIKTFKYQLVYSPQSKSLIYLNPLPDQIDMDELKQYAGSFFDKALHEQIEYEYSLGNVCPETLAFIDNYNPLEQRDSVWTSLVIRDRFENGIATGPKSIGHLYGDSDIASPPRMNTKSLEQEEPIITKEIVSKSIISYESESRRLLNERINSINSIRKENIPSRTRITSKYFSKTKINENFDDEDEDFLSNLVTIKDKSMNPDVSTSSIEEDEIACLKELNKSKSTNKGRNLFKHSNSLSSTQSSSYSQSSNTSSIDNLTPVSEIVPKVFKIALSECEPKIKSSKRGKNFNSKNVNSKRTKIQRKMNQ